MQPTTRLRLLIVLNVAFTVLFAWLAVRDALLGRYGWMAIQLALMAWSGWRTVSLLRLGRSSRAQEWR